MFPWILIAILIGTPLIIFTCYIPGTTVSPWVPTNKKAKYRVITMAKLTTEDTVIDLGCGNGVLLVEAYKKAHCKVMGVDCAPLQCFLAKLNFLVHGVKGKIKMQDLFKADISKATVIFLFLLPKVMEDLKPKLQKELRPGSKIVSYTFPFEDWEPNEVDWPKDQMPVYVYTVKKK